MSKHGTTTWSLRSTAAAEPQGRRLGYKTRTFASDPRDRDDRRIVVWVVVTTSNPDDENRIHQRGELLVQETLNKLLG
jgi:hypothetical protein